MRPRTKAGERNGSLATFARGTYSNEARTNAGETALMFGGDMKEFVLQ